MTKRIGFPPFIPARLSGADRDWRRLPGSCRRGTCHDAVIDANHNQSAMEQSTGPPHKKSAASPPRFSK
jgi:hypothetical protein